MKKAQPLGDYISQQYQKQGVKPDAAGKLAQRQAQKLTSPPKLKQPGNVSGVGKIAKPGQTVGKNPNQVAQNVIQEASRQSGKQQKRFKNDPSSW